MPAKNIFDVKDVNDFEDRVLKSKEPVIVSFDTPWCESCKTTNERLVRVVEKSKENLSIAKVDITQLKDLAHKYDVFAVPTLAVASEGKIHSQTGGMKEFTDIKNFVKESLTNKRNDDDDDELEFATWDVPRYY
ncbi:hypothetical protein PVAND_017492 [Polypedilum vanderplanki]|uniref:Thioredoxin n=1 Tax=Polypedilum vanderplanki TaxID=319348 RepID=S6BNH2_POLVA|nr:hypothetical protein PVAND_017492 [Polypedilum vanderplanki]BAN67604.1 thioredoxin [Polypedilum vanderplanki]